MTSVLIRLRADSQVGRGHLGRCLPLADALRVAGGHVTFAMEAVGPFLRTVEDRGFVVRPADTWPAAALCEETARHDVAVLDLPDLDREQVTAMRRAGRPLVGLSAAGDGIGMFDMLVNPVAEPALAALPAGTPRPPLVLSGADGVIIDGRRFADARRRAPRPGTVLISFGGGHGHTERSRAASVAVSSIDRAERVHVTSQGPLVGLSGKVHVHRDAAEFPGLLAEAELVVCGLGTTVYEAASLGRPALVVPQSPLHELQARWLEPHGFSSTVAGNEHDLPGALGAACHRLLGDAAERGRMADAGRRFVDPDTVATIADAVLGLSARGVTAGDEEIGELM